MHCLWRDTLLHLYDTLFKSIYSIIKVTAHSGSLFSDGSGQYEYNGT